MLQYWQSKIFILISRNKITYSISFLVKIFLFVILNSDTIIVRHISFI